MLFHIYRKINIKDLHIPCINYNFIFKIHITLFLNWLTYNFYSTTNIFHPIFLLMYILLFLSNVPLWGGGGACPWTHNAWRLGRDSLPLVLVVWWFFFLVIIKPPYEPNPTHLIMSKSNFLKFSKINWNNVDQVTFNVGIKVKYTWLYSKNDK
jgi:hypothetical protein